MLATYYLTVPQEHTMIPRVYFTRSRGQNASVCAELSGAGSLIAARRDDARLSEESGEKTADLFAKVMGMCDDVTDVYTTSTGVTMKIVVCLRDDQAETVVIGKVLQQILRKIFGGVGLSPPPFWLAPVTTHPPS